MDWKRSLITRHAGASQLVAERRTAYHAAAKIASDARARAARLSAEADRLEAHIAGMDIARRGILDPTIADQDKAARRLTAHDAARTIAEARLEEARRLASLARNAASDATAEETRQREAWETAQASEAAQDPAGYGIEPLAGQEVAIN